MAQQTAVEWLAEKWRNKALHSRLKQAKQMEKEQIIENNKLKAIVFYEQGCGKEGCKAKEPHVH
jgi:hypothetical protein